jgi:hypothetical protein
MTTYIHVHAYKLIYMQHTYIHTYILHIVHTSHIDAYIHDRVTYQLLSLKGTAR